MSTPFERAIEDIYTSLHNDNEDLDERIKALKVAMAGAQLKEAVFDAARLVQNNRQGRKHMQSYFKKRGVKVVFRVKTY